MADISRTINKVLAHLEQAEKELLALQGVERREGRTESWLALLQHLQQELRLARGKREELLGIGRVEDGAKLLKL